MYNVGDIYKERVVTGVFVDDNGDLQNIIKILNWEVVAVDCFGILCERNDVYKRFEI